MNPSLDEAWEEDGLFPAHISLIRDESPTLRLFEVDVEGSAASAPYETPGQYVKLSIAGLPEAFFSMASPPDLKGRLQFLLRLRGPMGEQVRGVTLRERVGISDVDGPGFPLHEGEGRDLLLFATGSGIAPIRALLLHCLARRGDFGAITLYYGERTADDLAFVGELQAWRERGVDVRLALSRASQEEIAALGGRPFHGYVQERLSAEVAPSPEAAAYLCGVDGMVQGVTKVLIRQGLSPSRIFLNY